jgi:hypothetical protein
VTEQQFVLTGAVFIRRIEQIAAEIDSSMNGSNRFLSVSSPVGARKTEAAQSKRGHDHVRVT